MMIRTISMLLVATGLWLVAGCSAGGGGAVKPPPPKAAVAGGVLQVEVQGIRSPEGVVRLALFESPKGFPGDHRIALRTAVYPAGPGNLQASFQEIGPGRYALAVIHDANDNGKLDTSWMGMPTEGYGVSNDAPARFGPPKFEDARFAPTGPVTSIAIRLRYP